VEEFGHASEGGGNMKLLHEFPFVVFQLLVNLRNGGFAGGGTGEGGSGANGEPKHVFKSVEEKAVFAQASINAALIAAGIQPAAHHNLFAHAASAAGLGLGTTHAELLMLIATPSIALPACQLVRVWRKMYEQRSLGEKSGCDVKLIIEDDSAPLAYSPDGTPLPRPVRSTLWAHRIVLACGSEFFRTVFRSQQAAEERERSRSGMGGNGGGGNGAAAQWDASSSSSDGVTTLRFPASSFTTSSLEAVLRYIYTNSTSGIDFVTALYCMNTHVTNYFGLREYSHGTSSTTPGAIVPASFQSDLEKACIAVLHTSLAASVSSGSLPTPPGAGGDCLTLISSAYAYGDRSLFEKACYFLTYEHLDLLMQNANRKKQGEERERKAGKLARLREKNERNAARREKQAARRTNGLGLISLNSPSAAASGASNATVVERKTLEEESEHDGQDSSSSSTEGEEFDSDDSTSAPDAGSASHKKASLPAAAAAASSEISTEPSSQAQFDFVSAIIREKALQAKRQAQAQAQAQAHK
jgi:hypothetical protein